MNLSSKIFVAFMLLLVPWLSAVGFISSFLAARAINEQALNTISQTLEQAKKNLVSVVDEVNNTLFIISMDRELQETLNSPAPQDEFSASQEVSRINRSLTFPGGLNRRYESFKVYALSRPLYPPLWAGGYVFNDSMVKEEEWFKKTLELQGKTFWRGPHAELFKAGTFISGLRAIKSVKNYQVTLAVASVEVNISTLADILGGITLGRTGYVLLVDKEGRVLYHRDPQKLGTVIQEDYISRVLGSAGAGNFLTTLGDRKTLIFYTTVEATGWKLVGVVPYKEAGGTARVIQNYTLLAIILSALAAALWAYRIASGITQPLGKLLQVMREVEKGDLSVRAEAATSDEISVLASGFNRMLHRIEGLIGQVVEATAKQKEAELKTLQAQVNPHFLYNVLESINWMAISRGAMDISKMVTSLAGIMRYSLSPREEVTLKEEIENIKRYLAIQKMRYGEKIDYVLDIAPGIENILIPKFTLQPLVENALVHGLEPKTGKGEIKISGYLKGEDIFLMVEDNGVGCEEGIIQEMLAGKTGGHLGLKLVEERIKIKFGPSYGLSFHSQPGQGTLVSLRLPRREAEEDGVHEIAGGGR